MHIKLENINKFYYSATSVEMALQKISLDFGDTGFVAVTGESGSGKSTLISVISGMLTFEEGEIYIDGKPMSEWDDSDLDEYRKNRIGFVFQEYNLIDEYTVYDNVESAIIIRGVRKDNIRSFAEEVIKRVGLEDFINQKASKLSSGQKQRLAIARALAKEADVIVADEPTGNLDSDNANKIMELFAEIAKEKLVIMVTHNYDMAEAYVNRQIRLFDGKVVSDTEIREAESSSKKKEELETKSEQNKWRIAWKYTLKNLIRQPFRSLLIALFVVVTAIVSYVFIGQIISNYDDTHTKIYDDDIFAYENDKRIIVKKADGSALTEEDINKFSSMEYVVTVDEYDLCNDIRYASVPGEDYYLTNYNTDNYNIIGGTEIRINDGRYVSFNEDVASKYMRSASCITDNDLIEGRLPQERNDIVMYIDGSLEDAGEQKIFFKNENFWGDTYYEQDFEVVGILKEETSQIYFSKSFCDMLTASYKQGKIRLEGGWCEVDRKYTYRESLIPIIGDEIEEYDISLSEYYNEPTKLCAGIAHKLCDIFFKESGTVNVYTDKLSNSGKIEEVVFEELYVSNPTELILAPFMCISEKFFYELYDYGSHQASLYIEHYAYTDKVIEALEKEGYDAISSYRVGALEEDQNKADNRVRLLLISFAILIVIAILEVFIVSSFFRLRRKFYSVLRFMGMESEIIRRINVLEINLYTIVAVTSTLVIMWLLDASKLVTWISEFRIYMEPIHYVIYIAYNFVLAQLLVLIYNRKKEVG